MSRDTHTIYDHEATQLITACRHLSPTLAQPQQRPRPTPTSPPPPRVAIHHVRLHLAQRRRLPPRPHPRSPPPPPPPPLGASHRRILPPRVYLPPLSARSFPSSPALLHSTSLVAPEAPRHRLPRRRRLLQDPRRRDARRAAARLRALRVPVHADA